MSFGGPGILDTWTIDNETVALFRREGNKRKVSQVPYTWYFLLSVDDYKKIDKGQWNGWRRTGLISKAELDPAGDYVRVYSDHHTYSEKGLKQELLDEIISCGARPLEADLSLAERYCVDNLVRVNGDYKVIYYDIETDDREKTIEIGKHQILCCGFITRDGRELWLADEDEQDLLSKVSRILSSFDVVVGWNSSRFDWPYLKARLEKYDMRNPLWRVANVDLLHRFVVSLYFSKLGIRSWSLKNVAERMLGKIKEDFSGHMTELFLKDRDRLRQYNLNDVRLVKELDEKTGMIDSLIRQAVLSGCPMRAISKEYRGTGKVIDTAILMETERQRKENRSNFRFSTVFWQSREEYISVTGGLVLEPKVGYHKMVYVYDFRSLYPNIIMSWNISPETFRAEKEDDCYSSVNGYFYKKNPIGIVPSVIQHFNEYRDELRAAQESMSPDTPEYQIHDVGQAVAKGMTNAVYGVMAQHGSRYFDKRIAESITLVGHYFLNQAIAFFAEVEGAEIIFGDTDSIAISWKGEEQSSLDAAIDMYVKMIKANLKADFQLSNPLIEFNLETVFDKFILCGKKNYMGHVIQSGEQPADFILVKGLESVKRNTIPYTVKILEGIYQMLLAPGGDEDAQPFRFFLAGQRTDFMTGQLIGEDLAISQMVSKYPSEYKSDLVYARIAGRMIEDGKSFHPGINIQYLITQGPPTNKKLDGVLLEEWDGVTLARDYYWDRKIWQPVNRILKVVFPDINWEQYKVHYKEKRK